MCVVFACQIRKPDQALASFQKQMSITLVEGGDLEKLKTWNPTTDKFSNRVVSLTNITKSFLAGELSCIVK